METLYVFSLSVAGTFIMWLFRLEFRTKRSEEKITELEKNGALLLSKHEQLDSRMMDELSQIRESLARIEGGLGIPKQKRK